MRKPYLVEPLWSSFCYLQKDLGPNKKRKALIRSVPAQEPAQGPPSSVEWNKNVSAGSLWLEFCGLCANPLYAPRSEAFACCCPFILNYTWLLLPSGISLLSPSPPWKSFLPTLKEFPGSLDGWDSALSAEGPSLVPGWRTRILQASRQGQKEEGVCATEPLFVQAVLTS